MNEEETNKARAAVSRALAALLSATTTAKIWQHKKRGTYYASIGRATVQAEKPIMKGDTVMVYMSSDGVLWVRPSAEFLDGRFAKGDNLLQGVMMP